MIKTARLSARVRLCVTLLADATDTAAAKGDPLYTARRTLHTGAALHTDKQRERIRALFAADEHVELEATWGSTSA